ncbi:MAG: alanine racemase, partial [Chloroflexota bacterium]|nr:alanine racemase [Chloroflexota bacterium]
ENYRPAVGTPVTELETPCLLIDMDALEHNFNLMAETYRNTTCKLRAHIKNLKSPVLAWMQIRAGGTVGGVCASKVSEAEVMVEAGITDILIANQVVTPDKIARLCSLAKRADVKVAIDDSRNLEMLSELAVQHGVTIGVVIEVDTSMHRAGTRHVQKGVELARLASRLPGIAFKGVMSHQTLPGRPDKETRMTRGREYMQMCVDVRDAIVAAGIPVEIVSTGESWTYDVAPAVTGVTEVEGGTYALMSAPYSYMEEFAIAGKVLATVVSTPEKGIAIGDVGSWALTAPRGALPEVDGMPGVSVEALRETHIVLRTDGRTPLRVGDRFLLRSAQQDLMVNRWDQFIAVRKGKVEAVWPVLARGCHN